MSFSVIKLHSLKQRGRLNLVWLICDVFIMCIFPLLIYLRLKLLDQEANLILLKKHLLQQNIDLHYLIMVFSHDWIDVSKSLLTTEFLLSDAYGKTIDLRGMPFSFSLVFMDQAD